MWNWVWRLHRDERGDVMQIVIISALIIIPLIMVLITFGTQIQEWLQEAFGALGGAQPIPRSVGR